LFRPDDLREEIDAHRALAEADAAARGLSAWEARDRARRDLGNTTRAMEDSRAVWLAPWIESVWRDVVYAARSLRSQPGFTIPALAALGLGIGLNASLFTVFNAVALQPWPVRDPGRVVKMLRAIAGRQTGFGGFSFAEYEYLKTHTRTLSGVMLDREEGIRLDDQATGRPRTALFVTGNYFDVLGIDLAKGRGIGEADDSAASPATVAVLSYYVWQTVYGSDPQIVGRRIRIDDTPFTVVGVTAENFIANNPSPPAVWVPLRTLPLVEPSDTWAKALFTDPDYCCSAVSARLAPGVSREQAEAELSGLGTQMRVDRSTKEGDRKPQRVVLTGTSFFAQPNRKRQAGAMFALMFAGVGLVLVLACANVGNLLIARSAARSREIASRLALGASRGRLIRQLLTESLLLGVVSCGLALVLAYVLPPVVMRYLIVDSPWMKLQPDRDVLLFSLALGIISAILFGLAPALRATRLSLSEVLKQGTVSAGRLWFRDALAALQVAISVALLICAGLMVRGLQVAHNLDLGFRTDVSLVTVDLPPNAYSDERARIVTDLLVERLRPLADRDRVAATAFAPLGNGRGVTGMYLPGQTEEQSIPMRVQFVSPGYFDVLGISILAGRDLTAEDRQRKSVVVNEAFARKYWQSESAIGKLVFTGKDRREIVGVVRDAQVSEIGPVEPCFFWSFSGIQRDTLLLRPRLGIGPAELGAAVRAVDPRAIINVTPMAAQLDRWLSSSRSASAIAGGLGLLALALATIGVFGVLAYSVEQRRREIGVRMALGARPSQVVRVVMRANVIAMAGGLIAGVGLAIVGSQALAGFMYGVSRLDLATYAGVLLILIVAGAAAAFLPAQRATRVDPLVALRYD
jgi:predicted permease